MNLFGCRHRNYTFPITSRQSPLSPAQSQTGTYVACLDCGQDLPYDWQRMKVVEKKDSAKAVGAYPLRKEDSREATKGQSSLASLPLSTAGKY